MDVELEFEDADEISNFLRSKLREIKLENTQLEASLQHRKEIKSQYSEKIAKKSIESGLKFGKVWKKIVNDKYVLGLEVQKENELELQNFAITLSWTSSSPLNYKFLLVANPTFSSAGLSNVNPERVIVIIFDIPTFNEVLSYTILGSMSYQHGNNKMVLKLPCPIQLVPQDVTDNSVIVHLYEVIDGSTDDILALTYSSQKYDFIMNTCHKSVENLFEEDCSLSRIKLKSDGKLFLVHKISPCLDGALLLVQDYTKNGTIHLSVYCRSLQVLSALLHYLHRQILNVFIIPKSLYREDLSVDEVTELVKNSLCKELDYLKQNWTGDVRAVRKNMTEKEHTTDCLMGRINEKRCS